MSSISRSENGVLAEIVAAHRAEMEVLRRRAERAERERDELRALLDALSASPSGTVSVPRSREDDAVPSVIGTW